MKKTVFITGASGFIGSNITRHLIDKGYKVTILIRKSSDTSRINKIISKTSVCYGDLSDIKNLTKMLKKHQIFHIIHCASYGNYPDQKDVKKMIDTNIYGLHNLLLASTSLRYKTFISIGTSSEYGYKKKPMTEEDVLKPESFYASTKASATLLAQSFAKIYDKPIYILRLFSVYGPFEEKTRLIPTIINAALANKKIQLTSSTSRHDFLYIDDLNELIVKILSGKNDNLKNGEILNVGTGNQYSNEEVVREIEKIMEIKMKMNKKFIKRSWDTDFWVANMKKTNKLLRWKPRYTLSQGLKETIKEQKLNEKN